MFRKNLLLGSAAALAAISFSFTAFASTSEDYEKALKSYNKAEYDEAYIHLKNSLQQDPENLAAKILMGKILLINGYLTAAELEFTEALDMGADINLLAEPLGNTWLFMNKYRDVINFTQTAKLTGDAAIKWQEIRATACIRTEDFECATKSYNTILSKDDNYVPAINGLASIAMQEENLFKAAQLIQRAEKLDDKNAITWRLKGQLAYRQGDTEKARACLQQSLMFNKEDPIALRNLVDLYLESNDYDQAKTFVDQIISKTPNDPLAILLNSWLASRSADSLIQNEQLQKLNDFMAELSPELIASQPMLLYISGLTNFFNKNLEKASQDFIAYLQKEPNDIQAVLLLAQTYMATQQDKQALILLEKHQNELTDNLDASLMLGDLLIRQNRAFKAEKLLDNLEKANPDNGRLQLFKIKLMAARGKQDEAIAILDANFEKLKDDPTFMFTFALLKLQAGQYDDALKASDILSRLFPQEAEVQNLKAGILIRQNKLTEAKAAIEQALALEPTLFAAKFNLAATESRLGNIEHSNKLVEELLAVSPKHTESLLLKAFNANRLGDRDQAMQIYNDILTLSPANVSARERLVEMYQAQNDDDAALYHIERLLKDDFDNPKFLLDKAGILIRQGKIADAQKTLNIVTNFIQSDVTSLIRFSNLQMQLNNPDEALAALNTAEKAQPENINLTFERIRLEIQLKKLDSAAKSLSILAKKYQDNPDYWVLRGQLAEAQSTPDNAVNYYEKALDIAPDFAKPLVELYNFALREQHVEVFLARARQILRTNPNNLLVKNLLAQYLFFIRNFDEASSLYAELLEEPQVLNKAQVYNRLAIMSIESDLEKAAFYISEADKLAPTDASVLDTYGWVLAQQGKFEDGLKKLRDAHARDANNPNIRYHLGYTLAKLGRIDEAKQELEFAVNVNRPFFLRPQARELLESL